MSPEPDPGERFIVDAFPDLMAADPDAFRTKVRRMAADPDARLPVLRRRQRRWVS